MTTTAFLGTGLLGGAFVEAALARGDRISVWNRTAEKARALAPLGAIVASTPAEAVRGAARVHLVLKDDAVVDDVIDQLRPGLDPAAIIVDHTTNLPALTAARARRLEAEGIEYLHCPVFIGPAMARKAQGTILVAGPATRFEKVREALQRQAARVEYLGERPDLAAVSKLCGNAFIIGLSALVADVYTMAGGAGIDPAASLKPLEYLNVAGIIATRGKTMAAGDFRPSFELAMARKDVRLMLELAGGGALAALPSIAHRMDQLIDEGLGAMDLAVLARDAVS